MANNGPYLAPTVPANPCWPLRSADRSRSFAARSRRLAAPLRCCRRTFNATSSRAQGPSISSLWPGSCSMRLQASDLKPHLLVFGFSDFTKEKNGGGFRFGQFAPGVILVHGQSGNASLATPKPVSVAETHLWPPRSPFPWRKRICGRPEAHFHGGNASLAAPKPVSVAEAHLWPARSPFPWWKRISGRPEARFHDGNQSWGTHESIPKSRFELPIPLTQRPQLRPAQRVAVPGPVLRGRRNPSRPARAAAQAPRRE